MIIASRCTGVVERFLRRQIAHVKNISYITKLLLILNLDFCCTSESVASILHEIFHLSYSLCVQEHRTETGIKI
jgi:hypothetical protein